MFKQLKKIANELSRVKPVKYGVLVLSLAVLFCAPLGAGQREKNDLITTTVGLSTLSLQENDQNIDPFAWKEPEDAFCWQNTKHYEATVRIFKDLADRELASIIDRLAQAIHHEKGFFKRNHKYMTSQLKDTIYHWMNEEVLSRASFYEEGTQHDISYSDESSDDGQEPWERAYMRGYEREEDSDFDMSSSSNEECDDYEEYDGYYLLDDFEADEEQEDKAYHDWQLGKLWRMLSIDIVSMDDFTKKSIDMCAMKRFLQEHCHSGDMRYSWLLNEIIEGSLSTSEDFASLIHEKIGLPQDFLNNLFGSLWFDYDWEKFELDDPCFIQKTYIKTLRSMQKGKRASDVKRRLLKRIQDLFTFNHDDFKAPLRGIREKYNGYNQRKDWLGALIEWSIYSTYRKVFANPAKRSKINSYSTAVPALPVFQNFNREDYLLRRLNAAYRRTQAEYTKVYPHSDTKKIVFGPPSPHRAELDIQKALSRLKGIGNFLEPHRKRDAENVFVPELYFVVSVKPNQASSSEGQQFLSVPLKFDGLPRRPLSRAPVDSIFAGVSDEDYFSQVKTDVVAGRVLQGKPKVEAEAEITTLINNKGLCKPNLIHSERGVMQALRKPTNVKKICTDLANHLKNSCGNGFYTVHGAVMLGYSTNTVCPCCTPTLISLQNSYEPGGFLNLLVQNLNGMQGPVRFQTTGYNLSTGRMDWSQFRLNTFITASIDFDPQGRDLAEQGQHSYGGNTNPPKETHNPHARLFFPHDEIDISDPVLLKNGLPDPNQRFFYEFVGKNIHTLPEKENPYFNGQGKLVFPGAVFSSGSDSWGHGKMQ